MPQDNDDNQGWDRGWEAHEREQQRRLAKLSLYEKVKWLEEMQEMIEHLRKQRNRQTAAVSDGGQGDHT